MYDLSYFYIFLLSSDSGNFTFLESIKDNFYQVISHSIFIYFLIFIGLLLILYFIFFLIQPLLRDNQKLFEKYLLLRQKMEEIDVQYSDKKINFVEYVSLQFNYAKEYEHIVNILVKDKFYAPKLKAYKFTEEKNEKAYEHQKNLDSLIAKQVDNLFNILAPISKFYKEEEIKIAIVDEGFDNEIANIVLFKLKNAGVKFDSETPKKENKLSDFLNTLFVKTTNSNLKEVDYDSEKITFRKVDPKSKQPKDIKETALGSKKTVLSSFKDLFKKKRNPTIDDLNKISVKINNKLN
ncbi:hypothetical protein M0P25_04045 [archaeon]|nr:hypothetical protein [archaeon]